MTQGGPPIEMNMWRSLWSRIRSRPRSGLAALLGLYFLSGLYYVPADAQGVRLRFGRLSQAHILPGLHYSWPFPIDRIVRLRINQAHRLSVGEIDVSRVLGTTDGSADNYLLSGDRNLVQLNASMQFYIDDPEAYLFRTEDLPESSRVPFLRLFPRQWPKRTWTRFSQSSAWRSRIESWSPCRTRSVDWDWEST